MLPNTGTWPCKHFFLVNRHNAKPCQWRMLRDAGGEKSISSRFLCVISCQSHINRPKHRGHRIAHTPNSRHWRVILQVSMVVSVVSPGFVLLFSPPSNGAFVLSSVKPRYWLWRERLLFWVFPFLQALIQPPTFLDGSIVGVLVHYLFLLYHLVSLYPLGLNPMLQVVNSLDFPHPMTVISVSSQNFEWSTKYPMHLPPHQTQYLSVVGCLHWETLSLCYLSFWYYLSFNAFEWGNPSFIPEQLTET